MFTRLKLRFPPSQSFLQFVIYIKRLEIGVAESTFAGIFGYGRFMKKRERQELKVERIQQYISSGKYDEALTMEIALKSEFGPVLGRLSKFEMQDINERIRQAGLDGTQ